MSNPQALLGVSGAVHSRNLVTYEGGVAKSTGRPYAGGSYVDLTILCDRSILDGVVGDVPSVITVRTDEATARSFSDGQLVDLLVTPFVDVFNHRGRWNNKVGYRLAAEIAAPAVASVPSRSTASSSTSSAA